MVTFSLIVITLQIKEKKESFGHSSTQNSPQRADTPPRSNKKYNLKRGHPSDVCMSLREAD